MKVSTRDIANLRHLYAQLIIKNERELAEGLLGPIIKRIEDTEMVTCEQHIMVYKKNGVCPKCHES